MPATREQVIAALKGDAPSKQDAVAYALWVLNQIASRRYYGGLAIQQAADAVWLVTEETRKHEWPSTGSTTTRSGA